MQMHEMANSWRGAVRNRSGRCSCGAGRGRPCGPRVAGRAPRLRDTPLRAHEELRSGLRVRHPSA